MSIQVHVHQKMKPTGLDFREELTDSEACHPKMPWLKFMQLMDLCNSSEKKMEEARIKLNPFKEKNIHKHTNTTDHVMIKAETGVMQFQ